MSPARVVFLGSFTWSQFSILGVQSRELAQGGERHWRHRNPQKPTETPSYCRYQRMPHVVLHLPVSSNPSDDPTLSIRCTSPEPRIPHRTG
eukprot:scaffold3681_cov257-Pinguiococcus_pyrenoidosus.AAC.2